MSQILGGAMDWLMPQIQLEGVGQYLFFKTIFEFIDEEIEVFQYNMLGETMYWASGIALTLVTLWMFWQGYRVMQGQARNAMEIVVDGARAAFIATLAMSITLGSSSVYEFITESLPAKISVVMTGEDTSFGKQVDESMRDMEAVMVAIDALDVSTGGSPTLKADTDRAKWMAGIGVAGPALVGGTLQIIYKVSLALFVGFAPLFILSLLFKATQSLFQKWLLYGIGTMFSYGLMAFMAVLVKKVVLAATGAIVAQYAIAQAPGGSGVSVSSIAMMQGGLGLLLTTALVAVPPIAAYFFQGTLGSYMAYSVFGSNAGAGQRPGEQGYRGAAAPTGTSQQQQVESRPPGLSRLSRLGGTEVPRDEVMTANTRARP